MRIEVLGTARVVDDADGPIEIGRPARRRLLSILALAGGRRVSTDALIDRFWPEGPPDSGRAALQTHVAGLRRQVGDDVVLTEGFGYRLNLDDHALDADEFSLLCADAARQCDQRRWDGALRSIDDALALWRGEPYVELIDDDHARPEITRLQELRLGLDERRAEALIGLDRAGEVISELEALVVEHPLRERLWEHLMRARYQMGRPSEALRAFRDVSDHLAEIGVVPGEGLRRLEEKILFHDRSLTSTPHNLPVELDTFVGREAEQRDVAKLVEENRLVTLTGPGGSGKTRLAVTVARSLVEAFPDGVWLVELAPLRTAEQIPNELAEVVGVRLTGEDPLADFATALSVDRVLIVLDNCEHLVEAVSGVARRLLELCPDVRILATSRTPLRVPAEVTSFVPGLSTPVADAGDASTSDAVRLFVDRAGRVQGSFVLDERNLEAIGEVCRRLDGLPLAIELAAARMTAFSPEMLAERIGDQLRLLGEGAPTSPPRHRTLEAAIEWSYDLLDADEQMVLRRLAILRGGFDLETAERLVGGDPIDARDVAGLVSALVDKSLVTPYDWHEERRYRLLETVRSFARERLEAAGELAGVAHALAAWGRWYGRRLWDGIYSGHETRAVQRLNEDFDNLAAALRWSEEVDESSDGTALLHATIAQHWRSLGFRALEEAELRRAVAASQDETFGAELRAHHAHALWGLGRTDEAWVEGRSAGDALRRGPPSPAAAFAVARFADLYWLSLDHSATEGWGLAAEAVRLAEEGGDPATEARVRITRAILLVSGGDEVEGLAEAERARSVLERVENPALALASYYNLITTLVTVRSVRRTEPRVIVERMLEVAESQQQLVDVAADWVAFIYMETGEWDEAARLLELDARATHLESMDKLSLLIPRATLHWMRGDLEAAALDLYAAADVGVHPRWYHDFWAIKAEVATDRGVLDETRDAAASYLAYDVDTTEAAKKLGTLHPLVRAEVEAALTSDGATRDDHAGRARDALATMHRILREHPAPASGSYMAETHDTHLTFAMAEVSRLERSDPELWRQARDEADYVYYRMYAQWRLAEALLDGDGAAEGASLLVEAIEDARRIGARLLLDRMVSTAKAHGVEANVRSGS